MAAASLEDFIEGNHGSLVSFVKRKLRDTGERDGEDLVQDVLLGILDAGNLADPVVNVSAYVFRALRNRIVDEYRRKRHRTASLDSGADEGLTLYEVLPDMKYEPRGSYAREVLRREIEDAIASLPPEQQEAIVETEFNGRSVRELSERTGTPQGTILARKHRGLRRIRKRLDHIKEEYHGTHQNG